MKTKIKIKFLNKFPVIFNKTIFKKIQNNMFLIVKTFFSNYFDNKNSYEKFCKSH